MIDEFLDGCIGMSPSSRVGFRFGTSALQAKMELALLRKQFNEAKDYAIKFAERQIQADAMMVSLAAERDRLLADKARLDWWEANPHDIKYMPVSRYWWIDDDHGSKGATIREAIDAARQSEQEAK